MERQERLRVVIYWFSASRLQTTAHILCGHGKAFCALERNKRRILRRLDTLSETIPEGRRVCKTCWALSPKREGKEREAV